MNKTVQCDLHLRLGKEIFFNPVQLSRYRCVGTTTFHATPNVCSGRYSNYVIFINHGTAGISLKVTKIKIVCLLKNNVNLGGIFNWSVYFRLLSWIIRGNDINDKMAKFYGFAIYEQWRMKDDLMRKKEMTSGNMHSYFLCKT